MSLAEAMLAGCIPVVTRAGALPELVGDTGVYIDAPEPSEIAAGVKRALELGAGSVLRRESASSRRFPLEARREGLLEAVAAYSERRLSVHGLGRLCEPLLQPLPSAFMR